MRMEHNSEWKAEFQDELTNALLNRFHIEDERRMLTYLMLRSAIGDVQKGRIKKKDLTEWTTATAHQVRRELGIVQETGVYQMKTISLTAYASPLRETLDDLTLSTSMTGSYVWEERCPEAKSLIDFLTKTFEALVKKAKEHAKKLTKQSYYEYYLKHFYLDELNALFQVHELQDVSLPHLLYEEEYLEPCLELYYQRYMDAFYFKHQEHRMVAEVEVENYLEKHLNELEPGLRMFSRQLVLDNGRIDLLAKDENGDLVIVEIKVKEDTDLVWQRQYYLDEIKNRFKTKNVRFFAVLPEDYPHITDLMKEFEDTHIYTFTLDVSKSKVSKMNFKRCA